ncbi:MAG: SH3 domain-containing protein [Bacteroidota bacterium]
MKTPLINQNRLLSTYLNFALLFFLLILFSACQQREELPDEPPTKECTVQLNGDRFIVEAPSGLRVRASPDLKAPILGKIPDGGEVIVQQVVAYYSDEIEGLNNNWVHLKFQQQDTVLEGYSFGGYLRRPPLDLEFLLPVWFYSPKAYADQQILSEFRTCAFTGTRSRWMFVHNGKDYVNGIQLPDSVSLVTMQGVLPDAYHVFTLRNAKQQTSALIIVYPNNEIQQFTGERFYISNQERIPLIAAVRADSPNSLTKINILTREVTIASEPMDYNIIGDDSWKPIVKE